MSLKKKQKQLDVLLNILEIQATQKRNELETSLSNIEKKKAVINNLNNYIYEYKEACSQLSGVQAYNITTFRNFSNSVEYVLLNEDVNLETMLKHQKKEFDDWFLLNGKVRACKLLVDKLSKKQQSDFNRQENREIEQLNLLKDYKKD